MFIIKSNDHHMFNVDSHHKNNNNSVCYPSSVISTSKSRTGWHTKLFRAKYVLSDCHSGGVGRTKWPL